jgi:hypothetical protein
VKDRPPVLRYALWGLFGILIVAVLVVLLPLVLFSGPFALAVKATIFIALVCPIAPRLSGPPRCRSRRPCTAFLAGDTAGVHL